jgi:hypothetical protein
MGLFDAVFGGGTDTSALEDGSRKAKKQLKKGIKKGKGALTEGRDTGIASLAEGLKAAKPYYQDAANNFDPYMQSGQQLNQFYTDQLTPGAPDHYTNTSGYNAVRDAGEQAIMRNNAAMGGTASGLNMADLDKYNVGLQEQYRQQYLDNLFRGSQQGLQAAGSQAGVLQNLGQMYNQGGINKAGIQTDTGARLADLYSGGHGAMATNQYNLGLGLQNQANADSQTQASLVNSIIGAGAKVAGKWVG